MATLVLKGFQCREESDEIDNDSPYFVIFEVKTNNLLTRNQLVAVIRRRADDNTVSTGSPFRRLDATVPLGEINERSVVLVALLEDDDNPDIGLLTVDEAGSVAKVAESAFAQQTVQEAMRFVLLAFAASGVHSVMQLAEGLKPAFASAINSAVINDDLLGVAHLPIPDRLGELPLLTFRGDGSHYEVRFVLK